MKDEAKIKRDELQTELNDSMPAENAGLESAKAVRFYIQLSPLYAPVY